VACIHPRHRANYPPAERLAILALKAARNWSLEKTAETFLVTAATIASWLKRVVDGGQAGGEDDDMTDDLPKPRWYRLTPDRLIVGLLASEGFLLASEHYQWFAFNRHKGWTSLIAVAAVAAAIVLMFLWFLAAVVLRRHFQFGVRLLLVLTLAVAVPCSWIAVGMKQGRVSIRYSRS
jgi:hypothetical protein